MKRKLTLLFAQSLLLFFTTSVVAQVTDNGMLQVDGNKIVNKNGKQIALAGNSFFWTNWENGFYNQNCVRWLKQDWGTTIIRAAMGVEDTDGYISDLAAGKTTNIDKVKALVDAAIAEDLYVLIDFHSHYAHLYETEAIAFFEEMATLYGQYDNVIYEIYNEPLYIDKTPENDGKFATWSTHIKPYAENVIDAIRAIDPDNLIIVGTGEWSQKVDDAANDPITDVNLTYGLHFYTIHHKKWLRDRADAALAKGISLFISEWGPIGESTNEPETDLWIDWCKENGISIVAWAVNDKDEPWSIVKPGSSKTGNWSSSNLTNAGILEKNIIQNWDITLNVDDVVPAQNELKIFQNGSIIYVEGLKRQRKFKIYSVSGAKIKSVKGSSFDTSGLTTGTYILKTENYSQKFIVQ